MAEQIRHRAPDLVILAYGTNEAGDDTPIDVYERQVVDELGRIARAAPTASCLLLGPPDRAWKTADGWVTIPKLMDIIAAQRRVAAAAGCAFYDQQAAMGGPGAISAWGALPVPRSGHDHVHLTREGYSVLGGTVASDLLAAYASWRAESGLPPGRMPGLPAGPTLTPLPPPTRPAPDPALPVASH
jgi:lysophospholipase L1-like esterase